ncbi:MAG: hypothetical protein DME54_05520 [Verrucomicrobia bacterium]|nr:MAG: hypothetical protein DME54_05520 [Verrucomicrobiota bacterium]
MASLRASLPLGRQVTIVVLAAASTDATSTDLLNRRSPRRTPLQRGCPLTNRVLDTQFIVREREMIIVT